MSVIVIGDVAHVVVEIELAEPIDSDLPDPLVHVGQMLDWWLGAMEAPHNHWHFADVTFGNPADIIFVIPGRDAGRAAEITPVDLSKGVRACHLRRSIAGANAPTVHWGSPVIGSDMRKRHYP